MNNRKGKQIIISLLLCLLVLSVSFGTVFSKEIEGNYKEITIRQEVPEETYIPILMYHHFKEEEVEAGNGVVVKISDFEDQIQTLIQNGYTIINLEELNQILTEAFNERLLNNGKNEQKSFGRKYICLTVDDGYRSNYELMYPLLQKYQVKADISVVAARIHSDYVIVPEVEKLKWEDLNEMENSGLVHIYNHTYNHKDALKVTIGEFMTSVTATEELLNERLDKRSSIRVLAYPNGSSDILTRTKVRNLGFDLQLSTKFGVVTKNTSINEIPRITVNSGESGQDLIKKIKAAAQRTFYPTN